MSSKIKARVRWLKGMKLGSIWIDEVMRVWGGKQVDVQAGARANALKLKEVPNVRLAPEIGLFSGASTRGIVRKIAPKP
jgi:hypothetical protein